MAPPTWERSRRRGAGAGEDAGARPSGDVFLARYSAGVLKEISIQGVAWERASEAMESIGEVFHSEVSREGTCVTGASVYETAVY